jgi:hypothetical protein
LHKAPAQIPVILGSLRQELLSEREQLRRKIRRYQDPHHIQITAKGLCQFSHRVRLGNIADEFLSDSNPANHT